MEFKEFIKLSEKDNIKNITGGGIGIETSHTESATTIGTSGKTRVDTKITDACITF